MNTIKVIGQAISSTNYATDRLFNFNPEMIRDAAENYLASGVTELEVPEGVLDPEQEGQDGFDQARMEKTVSLMPAETTVLGSYFGGCGDGNFQSFVATKKRQIDHLMEYFPDFTYAMAHPAGPDSGDPDIARKMVDAWAQIAEHGAGKKDKFQMCFHNHFDSSAETADQVSAYLDAIEKTNLPSLTWGPDTGHCHGMGDRYLEVFDQYAHLIGNHFHIKARVVAFDQLHGGDLYAADRDIWGNKAEFGRGLYSGFVNCADPEIHTPFKEVFDLIRKKARPTDGVVTGAMEIDVPRQHPRLEIMLAVIYLKRVHGIEAGEPLSYEQIVERVFAR